MSSAPGARAQRLTWIGHATVLLEVDGVRLMTDPLLRNWIMFLRRHGPSPAAGLLENLDAVLVSHLHLDHLDVPSLRRLGADVPLVVPKGAGSFVGGLGFRDVAELGVGEVIAIGDVRITAVPAVHDGRRRPLGPVAPALGYLTSGTCRIYFAGDTALFAEMAAIDDALDVALLPIWGWGPTIGPGHMGPRDAARAAALLRPAVAVPIHWGTFLPLGLGRLRRATLVDPPGTFVREAARFAPDVGVRVLAPGGELPLTSSTPP
ncbi:MAG: MBL fold metallo-hydrolase [Solirubrobacteraceae bacterium]|nr:MBL fold metallo-hydrolase [Solirubrobacteraceae bacterium]